MIDLRNLHHVERDMVHLFITQKMPQVSGSEAVRELLKHALKRLNISDTLNETRHPYQLQLNKQLVSFSHSSLRVAVAIAKNELAGLGIDVEDSMVRMDVAQRFYALAEVAWLQQLSLTEQQHATNLLWMAKESYIKAQQNLDSGNQKPNLFAGLKLDLSQVASKLLKTPDAWLELDSAHQLYVNNELSLAVCVRVSTSF